MNNIEKRPGDNEQQASSGEESRQPLIGKVDLERGYATDCPGDGEGDRNDTREMDALNNDQ